MKLSNVAVLTVLVFHDACATQVLFQPHKVSLEALVDDDAFENARDSLWDALTQVGMVSITGIKGLNKKEVLSSLNPCALKSDATKEQELLDGTRRRTFATHTVPGPGGMQTISHSSPDCEEFSKASDAFRQSVASVTEAFANRLASLLSSQEDQANQKKPLLSTPEGYPFNTFADVVENGQHLEHFHSYQGSSSSSSPKKTDETIEWHTDQGLFIVFTPALLVSQSSSVTKGPTEGFYVQLQDGTKTMVDFTDEDDLVIMLGDGVNQYINPSFPKTSSRALRATPHALTMPSHSQDETRVWYGRMVLPPSTAVHPQHQETFGRLRELIVDQQTQDADALSIGCSSSSNARQLQTTECEDGTLLCWHRCMSLEEFGVSEESCAEQGIDLWCINPRSQLWDFTHGDWFPACIDSSTAENGTAYPTLPNFPRNDEVCTDAEFEAFVSKGAEDYEHTMDLGSGAMFMWSVKDDHIAGRLAYNGIFGYLSMGFSGVLENAMQGAKVIMALPGGNYSAITGLDLAMDHNVHEYEIDHSSEKKSFRHWMTPVSDVEAATSRAANTENLYAVEATDCFTELTFDTSTIYDQKFNLSGTDHLIWAANSQDYFAGYHAARGKFEVNWSAGPMDDGEGDDGEVQGTSGSPFRGSVAILLGMALGLCFF
jgi:hypothetical protein